jgi:hypothetical protein
MQSTPAQLLDFKDWIPCEARTYVHYISLLHARSHATYYAEHLLAQNLGRPLTPASVETVRAWIQSNLGERGYAFAKKGDKEAENPDRVPYTDEEVVYTAFALALKTGKDTIILTRDEDLLDQFYRFTYLLDSHYRSYLIATRYANDPTAFHADAYPRVIWPTSSSTGPSTSYTGLTTFRTMSYPKALRQYQYSATWLAISTRALAF